ncbi:MAG: outer membrane protein assembly factor BamD [Burkholderiales bacterium]
MKRSVLALLLATAAALLSGCGLTGSEKDDTVGWSAQKLYAEAKAEMDSKNYEKAIKHLEKLEARYPYGRFAQQAQIDMAYAYYKNGDRAQAIAACDRFIKLYPNHANVDYAYYMKGLVNFNENLGIMSIIDTPDMTERDSKGTREAFDAFKELVTRFPESKYAEDARARMRYLVNSLAQYEVHVARYYMKRGAYVAAANRAQFAVKNYPQAPATEEAVFIMVKAYDALGMTDLRDASDRVMRKNFPDSKYLSGKGGPGAPWWKLWDPNW